MTKKKTIWSIAVILLVGAVILIGSYISDSRRFVDIKSVTDHFYSGSYEKTKDICVGEMNCTQAYTTVRGVTLLKFDSRESASKAAGRLGRKAYQSDYVVIDFSHSSASPNEEQDIKTVLDSMNTSH